MKIETAYLTLGLDPNSGATLDDIKMQYRLMALKYHPDKCKEDDAAEKFRKVHEAYQLLSHVVESGDFDLEKDEEERESNFHGRDYKSMVVGFLSKLFFQESVANEVYQDLCTLIVTKILGLCEQKAIEYLRKIDRTTLQKIYVLLQKHREVFHLSDELMANIASTLNEPAPQNGSLVLLNPFLEDLQMDNLYKIRENGQTFIVPLWHDELVYDNSGVDLVIRCCPVLPDNIELDEFNNIHVYLAYSLSELWGAPEIEVVVGNRTVVFCPADLKLTPEIQRIRFAKQGISKIHPTDPFDNSERADLVLCIRIT